MSRWISWTSVALLGAVVCAGFYGPAVVRMSYAQEARAQDAKPANPPLRDDELFELMRVFADTFEQVERNYVKEIDRRKLIEAALRGMMEELDPHSNYISPDDLGRFRAQVEQEFGGIGIQVSVDPQSRRLTVMTPLPGTPAYRAGIRSGDTIVEIEGKSAVGMSIDDAVKIMKGKKGEPVTIGIVHPGTSKVEKLTIVRDIIQVATVLGDTHKSDDTWNFMYDEDKKIAYVRITAFSQNTTKELKDAMEDVTARGMKGLVIDLRFNPGGLLRSAIQISDMYLDEGKIVSTKGRNTAENVTYAKKEETYRGFPIAVLVNRFSASASEIVSAALQDHKRAVVVGERTFGKGSVQNVIELEEGKSALKLTTAAYFRPSGKNIHRFPGAKDEDEWGVSPNESFDLKLTNDEMTKYLEYRRQRDVLGREPVKSDFEDKQLKRALEYLHAELAKVTTTESKPAPTKPAEKSSAANVPQPPAKTTGGKDGAWLNLWKAVPWLQTWLPVAT